MKCIKVFIVSFFLISCTTTAVNLSEPVSQPSFLDQAVHFKNQKKWDQAELEINNYLSQTKDIYWQGSALLLLGEVQEGRGQDTQAIDTYMKLLNHGTGYQTSHVAKGLYQLSWIYERQKNCYKVVVTLNDLLTQTQPTDEFIQNVETPARLANCYYVLNQWDKAKQLRQRAQTQLQKVSQGLVKDAIYWRSYLHLSYVGTLPNEKTDARLRDVISIGQKDLLLVIEQAPSPYGDMATDKLYNMYQTLFEEMTLLPKAKNPVEKNESNLKLVADLSLLVDLIEELKAARTPEGIARNSTDVFFMKIKDIQLKSRKIVEQLDVGLQKEKKGKK